MEVTGVTEDELNGKVMDDFIDLLKTMGAIGQSVGANYGFNGSEAMALHKIDDPVSMKELSQRLGCDASFVTVIADSLERLGIARREPSQRDRRVKNIVLTEHGREVKDQIMREVTALLPWGNALDTDERDCLLRLLNKMLAGTKGAQLSQP
jgi:DNA-binding MarR family transcriptional regulator